MPSDFQKETISKLPDGRCRIHARLCTVRRIGKPLAAAFLESCHPFGDASCRYRYGLFFGEELIAVGTFSSIRHITLDGADSSSCEWVRYATLDGLQVMGGMGKVLKAFIDEVHPGDVMTYAPQGYDGGAYIRLGFRREGEKVFPSGGRSVKFRLLL